MTVDLNISGGRVWLNQALHEVTVSVQDEKIAAISAPAYAPAAAQTLDATGLLVLPGALDTHIHSRDPGSTEREDFRTVTEAAACGGITTVLDMPNNIPPCSSVPHFNAKRQMAEQKALVDFGLYAGAGSDNLEEIGKLAEAGAVAFKTFLTKLAPDRVAEMKGLIVHDDGSYLEMLKEIQKTGLLSCIHAENKEINEYAMHKLQQAGEKDVWAFSKGRPPLSEIEATAKTLLFAKHTGVRVHLCHIYDPEAVALVQQAKSQGVMATSELTPNYLFLNEADMERLGPHGCVIPPLRSEAYQKAAYENYLSGAIDIINSDHAPYTNAEIARGQEDIWLAPPDGSAIEVMLPLLLNEVNRGKLSLRRLVESLMEKPAQLFGLYPRKGLIAVGSDADLVFVDMNKEHLLQGKNLHTKQQMTQYEGLKIKGVPVLTMVRGTTVMQNNKIMVQPGFGSFIQPNYPQI